jgi:hypothetical protein
MNDLLHCIAPSLTKKGAERKFDVTLNAPEVAHRLDALRIQILSCLWNMRA